MRKRGDRRAAARPVYPAAEEDIRRAIRSRELLVAWRSRHANDAQALEAAGRRARGLSRELPEGFDDAVAAVIGRAARVGGGRAPRPLP
jgi:hypothetical protein